VLRIESMAHNFKELDCGRSVEEFSPHRYGVEGHPGAIHAGTVLLVSGRIHFLGTRGSDGRVQRQPKQCYSPRQAAYDLKKLRGKQMVWWSGSARPIITEPLRPACLKALTALVVLCEKAIRPCWLLPNKSNLRADRGIRRRSTTTTKP